MSPGRSHPYARCMRLDEVAVWFGSLDQALLFLLILPLVVLATVFWSERQRSRKGRPGAPPEDD